MIRVRYNQISIISYPSPPRDPISHVHQRQFIYPVNNYVSSLLIHLMTRHFSHQKFPDIFSFLLAPNSLIECRSPGCRFTGMTFHEIIHHLYSRDSILTRRIDNINMMVIPLAIGCSRLNSDTSFSFEFH